MAQFRADLLRSVGLERARQILVRFGTFSGEADAAAMKRIFHWDSAEEWLKAGPRLHTLQGMAKAVIRRMDFDESVGRLEMEVVWHGSSEAEEHLAEMGHTDHPVCWILVGYASGYASYCLQKTVYFVERKCRAKGDRICQAVGKDVDSWGEEIRPHLVYFQPGDIKDKVQKLTEQLRKQEAELARQRRQLGLLDRESKSHFFEVRSKSFQRTLDLANRIAPYDTSMLITGETGVGKEVLARYMHRLSHRSEGPFVAVNCGALPETLLEGELFGHKAGAFTGAIEDRVGLFEQAQGGTIFLDEIGDITQAMQLKLLRVLQEKEILRVGESVPRKIDVRVMAATNRDLAAAVKGGSFRQDLYYRLRVIEVEVPPLRERQADILALARQFVERFAKRLDIPNLRLDATCVDYLRDYSWPGNIRELENAVERAAVLSEDGLILPEHLPRSILQADRHALPTANRLNRTLADVEYDHIRAVLVATEGNRTRAAEILGISPTTLWRKLKP